MAASKPPGPPARKPADAGAPESKAPGATGTGPRPRGRIVHDERGNAVWKWGGDGTRSDSTSRVLRRLDTPELSIEGQEDPTRGPDKARAASAGQATARYKIPKIQGRAPVVDEGGGYNPYNLTTPVKKETTAKKPVPPKARG